MTTSPHDHPREAPTMTTAAAQTAAEFWGEPIHVYTRAQAIADQQLIAVPEHLARQAGFGRPLVLTAAAWADTVAWTEEDEQRKRGQALQDPTGRLWDVLTMAMHAARLNTQANRIRFSLVRIPREGRGLRARLVHLVLHVGPGDNGEPVFTIMEPGED